MSTTVLEALQNAQINFETIGRMGANRHPIFMMALEQLSNGIKALNNGMSIDDLIQEEAFSEVKTSNEKAPG